MYIYIYTYNMYVKVLIEMRIKFVEKSKTLKISIFFIFWEKK